MTSVNKHQAFNTKATYISPSSITASYNLTHNTRKTCNIRENVQLPYHVALGLQHPTIKFPHKLRHAAWFEDHNVKGYLKDWTNISSKSTPWIPLFPPLPTQQRNLHYKYIHSFSSKCTIKLHTTPHTIVPWPLCCRRNDHVAIDEIWRYLDKL